MAAAAPLRPLSADELAWVEASAAAAVRQQADATKAVSFDDPPDGFLAVLRRERP